MRLGLDGAEAEAPKDSFQIKAARPRPQALEVKLDAAELSAHKELILGMGDKAVWQKVWRKQSRH